MARPAPPRVEGDGPLVALRKRNCMICDAGEEEFQTLNEVIWDGARTRLIGYRAAGLRAMAALGSPGMDPKTITRHAEHIERSWHIVDALHPQVGRETPVHAEDFRGVTGRFIAIGHDALTSLEASMGSGLMEDADLVKVAALGLQAAKMRQVAERVSIGGLLGLPAEMVALFSGVSGHLRPGDISEYEGIFKDVTPHPIEDMRGEMAAEREQLKALQAGT